MGYFTYFSFAAGLEKPIWVEKGAIQRMLDHVAEIEKALNLTREKYLDNPEHWTRESKKFVGIDDDKLCAVVSRHNRYIRAFYDQLAECSKKGKRPNTERLTPKKAQEFWHALDELHVEPGRWSADYYREEMERIYEVMRGRETDGVSFNAKKPLTPEQADAVICLFSEFLDSHDIRLAVPVGHDRLASSYDGEYDWSSTCGAIDSDEFEHHGSTCRKKDCDVRQQWKADREEEGKS